MEAIPSELFTIIALVYILWELPWKGVGLWKAAQLSHKRWFIAILIFNTLGILPIVYLKFVAKKYSVEVKEEEVN